MTNFYCCLEKLFDKKIKQINNGQNICSKIKTISTVPLSITEPGKYCVINDLIYDGPNSAITITANNVLLDFNKHDLLLTNNSAVGILAENVSELQIINDKIILQNNIITTATSAAIQLNNVTKASFDNIYTKGTKKGIALLNSNDIRIENSFFENHYGTFINDVRDPGSGVESKNSNSIYVNNCSFQGEILGTSDIIYFGIVLDENSSSVEIFDCQFNNTNDGIFAISVNGLIICRVDIKLSPATFFHFIELGFQSIKEGSNVLIKDSLMSTDNNPDGLDGIILNNGSGVIIENVIITAPTRPNLDIGANITAAVHIGYPPGFYKNIQLNGVIINGENVDAIVIHNASNVNIKNTNVSGTSRNNIRLINGDNVTIKTSDIQDSTGTGILIENGSTRNAIISNTIRNNSLAGINLQGSGNIVVKNTLYANGVPIIDSGENFVSDNFIAPS